MNNGIFINLVLWLVCTMMCIASIVTCVLFGAWWQLITAAMFGAMSYTIYVDDEYCESVRSYIHGKIKK